MKKRRLNLYGKIFLVVLGIGIILFGYGIGYLIKESRDEINIIKNDKNYTMRISYPQFHNNSLDKIMEDFINENKNEFLNTVEKYKKEEENFKYEFSTDYYVSEYKNLRFIHSIIYAYTGGSHHTRVDKTISYNVETKELVNLDSFFKDKSYLERLSVLSEYYVIKYFENKGTSYNLDMIKDGVSADSDNFKHFKFSDEGLDLTFPPYQVASWADGEVNIIIPYEEINSYLKEEYVNNSNSNSNNNDNVVVQDRDLTPYKDKKLIAITFDDGPGYKTTNRLLDGLKERDARVTFFTLGTRVKQYGDIVKRAYSEGHQIGSHTYNHLNLKLLSDREIINEVMNTDLLIEDLIGEKPTLLRPPYGNVNDNIKSLANKHIILWNVDTLDWKYHDSDVVANNIVKNAHDGAIVLLHDIYNTSVDGALKAIDILKEQGYAFVTIEEMCELKGIELDYTTSYFNFK